MLSDGNYCIYTNVSKNGVVMKEIYFRQLARTKAKSVKWHQAYYTLVLYFSQSSLVDSELAY